MVVSGHRGVFLKTPLVEHSCPLPGFGEGEQITKGKKRIATGEKKTGKNGAGDLFYHATWKLEETQEYLPPAKGIVPVSAPENLQPDRK